MPVRSLDTVFTDFEETLGPKSPQTAELARFRRFLVKHGGFRKEASAERKERIAGLAEALRCFHFSQYLDWYLSEKEELSRREVEAARAALGRFNEWLRENQIIGVAEFEENRESILGGEEGPPVCPEVGASEDAPDIPDLAEERDFHVPGEYSSLLSGEFVLTKVQEGILYGRRNGDPREIGPILVDRAVSGGSRVGDRVHLSLGRAGGHWNLLGFGRRKE